LTTHDIREQIIRDLGPSSAYVTTTFFDELMDDIANLLEEDNKKLIIFVDGVNEADNPKMLLKSINEAVGRISSNRIRLVFSCRTIIWNTLFEAGDFLYQQKYFGFRAR